MKITVEHRPGAENEIVLRCAAVDEEMLEVLSLLKNRVERIAAEKDGALFLLQPRQVYYAEAVDDRVFLYTADAVFAARQTLSQLELRYAELGFLRVGKSQLVNLHHVKSLKRLVNSRIELTLATGERLIVSRHYIPALKARLNVGATEKEGF